MTNLYVGSKGDSVKSLQQQLVSQGYGISVDGSFGNQTKSALMQYQKANNLKVDGIAGSQTFGSLSSKAQPASTPSPAPVQQSVAQPVATPSAPTAPTDTLSQYGYNETAEMDKLQAEVDASKNAQIQASTAGLDAKLSSDTAELQKAYDQAVADGQISVRDAEAEFATKKAELEKQAYTDSQRTTLYGQDMGIQNSQQQVGLMQGDQARSANMTNANMSARDKRVNDIKDRLNAVSKQKNLDLANAKSQRDAGVIQATAQATAQASDKMFGVKDTAQKAKMQQAQQKEVQAIEFQNSLKQLQEQSTLRIKEMNVQQGLDLQKMGVDLQNQIALEAKKYGYSSALQSQSAKNAIKQITAQAQAEMQAEEKAYNTARARELAKYTPGTQEYEIKSGQLKDAYETNIANIHAGTVYDAVSKSILNDPALTTALPKKPVDVSRDYGIVGNLVTGYSASKSTAYDSAVKAQKAAVARKNDFISNPTKYLPNPTTTKTKTNRALME